MLAIARKRGVLGLTALMLLASVSVSSSFGAEKSKTKVKTKTNNTTVLVSEMCGGCVKKITKRFKKEKAVAKVVCDIKKQTVTFVPAKKVQLSPTGLWEIMESIGKKPKKMLSPYGTFTGKPKKVGNRYVFLTTKVKK